MRYKYTFEDEDGATLTFYLFYREDEEAPETVITTAGDAMYVAQLQPSMPWSGRRPRRLRRIP